MSEESAPPTSTTESSTPSTPSTPSTAATPGADKVSAPQPGGNESSASGKEFADASRDSGASSRQYDAYREAGFSDIGRDYVGSQHNYYQGSTPSSRPQLLSQQVLDAARSRFAEPPQWEELRRRICKSSAVLLRGPMGSGRVVAALRATAPAGDDGPVYDLGDPTDLSDLESLLRGARNPDGGFERDARFLLIRPKDIGRLTAAELQRHTDALERAGARLIVIVDIGTDLADANLGAHMVEIAEGPGFGAVVERHLCAELGEAAAVRHLAVPALRQLIDQESGFGPNCFAAAALAKSIAESIGIHGFVEIERIKDECAGRRRVERLGWLASIGQPHTLCHAVALAVFDGHPHEVVAAAAGSLLRRLESTETLALSAGPDTDPAAPALRHTRTTWLFQLRAKDTIPAVGSPGRAETVAYEDAAVPRIVWRQVLLHVWSQYPIHAELLDWLGELCESSTDIQQVYIGRAVGLFASVSYDYVFDNALYGWTADEDARRREVVAHALAYVAHIKPDLVDRTRQLLISLYRQRVVESPESVCRLAAAARIEALSLGVDDPVQPVTALTRLLYVDERPVTYAVGGSLADLLIRIVNRHDDGAERDARTLLAALDSAACDPRRASAAQLAFLAINIRVVSRVGTDPHRQAWPALLTLTGPWPSIRTPIASLWRRSLYEAAHHQLALYVLDIWAFQAEQDVELRHELLRLIREVIRGDARVCGIVERRAAEWARPDNLLPTPETQAGLMAVVRTEKDRRA